jgi:hypothetical protein
MWLGRARARVRWLLPLAYICTVAGCGGSWAGKQHPNPHPRLVLVPTLPEQQLRTVSYPQVCALTCPKPTATEHLVSCANAQASERELAELAPMAKDLMICTYKERP